MRRTPAPRPLHSRRRFRLSRTRLGQLLGALVAALAVAACGSSSSGSGSGSSSGSAQSLLKQTFSSGHTVKSGVLAVSLSLNPSGSSTLTTPLSLSLSGPFQSRGKGKLPESNFTVAISALGRQGSLGVVSTGTNGYVTLQGAAYQLPAADFQRLESSFSSAGSPGGGQSGLSAFGIDPLHWLKSPAIVGSDNVGGADTTHIRAGVNVAALLSDLNTLLAKTAKSTAAAGAKIPTSIPAATEQKIAAAIKGATVDIWTGKSDNTLRKLALKLTVPVTGQASTLLGGLRSAGIGLTVQYANLNQPQSISTPANVRPYTEFTAKVQSLMSGLQGALGAGAAGAAGGIGSGSSSAPGAGTSAGSSSAVQKYSRCIVSAGQDVTKMQKCASLLNG
jgi:hypothetical protein